MFKKYKFIRDYFFLISLIIYGLNYVSIKFGIYTNYFMQCYFNDIFLVPVALPVVLYIVKLLKYRGSYYPTLSEILTCLIIWSVFFEYIGPKYLNKGIADVYDVIAYFIGAVVSFIVWRIKVDY